jgi:hypothetical protein
MISRTVRITLLATTGVVGFGAALLAQQPTPNHFDGKTWWGYVKVLADDKMQGRETGSSELREAEAFVVEQLKKSGLEPAGSDDFYQLVKLKSKQIVEKDSSAALVRDGKAEPLVLGEGAYFGTRGNLAPHVEAQLVFVGYGLSVPELNYDDLAGLDLKGKIAISFAGSPSNIPGALASHYRSAAERGKAFRKAGIVGSIAIPNPGSMDIPWSRMSANRAHVSMELVGEEFNETAGEQLSMIFNPSAADKLFAGSGHTFAEIVDLAKAGQQLPRFPLIASIQATTKVEEKEVDSANIVARLPGTDPALKNEYVVLSAHIDHIGVGEPINGDRIYNGAMDNA